MFTRRCKVGPSPRHFSKKLLNFKLQYCSTWLGIDYWDILAKTFYSSLKFIISSFSLNSSFKFIISSLKFIISSLKFIISSLSLNSSFKFIISSVKLIISSVKFIISFLSLNSSLKPRQFLKVLLVLMVFLSKKSYLS